MRDATCQLPDRLEPLSLPQRRLCSLTALRLGIKPPRAPERHADDHQQEQCRGQAEDQMACHGCEPSAADRRAIDAGDDVDWKALELAIADPAFNLVELRSRDGVDDALPTLSDHLVKTASWRQPLLAVGGLRIAGEKLSVIADQRIKASRAAPDERIEFLEVARQHGDRRHAVERTVRRGAASGEDEERSAKGRQSRSERVADVSAGMSGHMHVEEASVVHAEIGRHLRELAGDERAAVTIDQKDSAQLR